MLEIMLTRPQGLLDQLEAMHRVLARSIGADGAPGNLRSMGQGSFPEVNVGRTAKSVEVFAFAPGLDASTIDVTVERGVLKISGARPSELPRGEARVQMYANERPQGRFVRAISLPDDARHVQGGGPVPQRRAARQRRAGRGGAAAAHRRAMSPFLQPLPQRRTIMSDRNDLTTKPAAETSERPVAPAIDVFEDAAGITLLADMPGVSRESLDVRLDGETLTVEGRLDLDLPQDMRALWAEVQVAKFRRVFTLGRELDAARIEANLKDGVLNLRVPKLAQAQARRIEVATA